MVARSLVLGDLQRSPAEIMKPEPQHQPRAQLWMRFSIRTAMLLVAVAALCIATYRAGVNHGRSIGPLVPTSISASNLYTREYDISDIVASDEDTQLLIDAIRNSVDPTNWDVAGGYAELHHDSGSHTLTVSHVWPGHIDLVRYLETVREFATYGGDLDTVLEKATTNL